MKIKLFSNTSIKGLEETVNEWLSELNNERVKDIKFTAPTETKYWEGNAGITPSQDDTFYTIMVIYN